MNKKINVAIVVFLIFALYHTASAQDVEDVIRKGENVLKEADEFSKKWIGEVAKLTISNGFTHNIIVKATITSDQDNGFNFILSPGGLETYEMKVKTEKPMKILVNFNVFRDSIDSENLLFSSKQEFTFSSDNRVQAWTLNEKNSRDYGIVGETAVMFINRLKNHISITGFNKGSQFTKVIESDEFVTVSFNSDDAPLANVVIEEWVEDSDGKMAVFRSKKKTIIFQNFLFDPFIIDEDSMR